MSELFEEVDINIIKSLRQEAKDLINNKELVLYSDNELNFDAITAQRHIEANLIHINIPFEIGLEESIEGLVVVFDEEKN